MLEVKNLHAKIGDKEILKGIDLVINDGETHAIMGPNGSGKSTLSAVLVGNPLYEVTEGEAYFNGKNLLEMKPEDPQAGEPDGDLHRGSDGDHGTGARAFLISFLYVAESPVSGFFLFRKIKKSDESALKSSKKVIY